MLYLSLRCGTGNENKQNEAGFDPFFNKTVIISQNCNFLLHVSPLLGHVLALGNPEVPASEEPLGRHVDHQKSTLVYALSLSLSLSLFRLARGGGNC